jgi:hypothetical protein
VTYIVLLDGRVLESWSEPLRLSPWQEHPRADVHHEELRRWHKRSWSNEDGLSEPEKVVRWLEMAVGGVTALADLDEVPLPDEALDLPESARFRPDEREDVLDVAALVDGVAERFFDPEVRTAMRRALAATSEHLLLGSRPSAPANAAAAVVWAVAKGNALVGPGRRATMKAIAEHLGVPSMSAEKGREVARLLRPSDSAWFSTPWQVRDLEPLGRAGLLTAQTRRRIIATRDSALVELGREAERDLAREQARALGREQARLMVSAMYEGREQVRRLRTDDGVYEGVFEEVKSPRVELWREFDDEPSDGPEFHGRASA